MRQPAQKRKKPTTEKDDVAEKRYIARKYYALVKTPLGEMLQLHHSNCKKEETSATGKRASEKKHQSKKQISEKTHSNSEKGRSFKKHLSAEEDIPTYRGCPNKKSHPGEEGCSVETVNLARSTPFAGEHIPAGRDGHIRSHPAEEGRLLERGYNVEKRPSTGKEHATWRSHPQKKSNSAEGDEESNTGQNAGSVEKSHHSKEKSYLVDKSSSGFMPTVPVQKHMKNTPEEESNTGENGCPVEEGHHSQEQGFPVEKPS
ncbi:hypothetical protein I79_018565 [Cricetulus griseus]|uniref:Uncharacterized protein n=1 Tax=Cricetulus griseus TaxID=10029 RepID=G3I524_CRIGR|nr:hypothetical protein I79_018565 [Cricetulus griseus]